MQGPVRDAEFVEVADKVLDVIQARARLAPALEDQADGFGLGKAGDEFLMAAFGDEGIGPDFFFSAPSPRRQRDGKKRKCA